MALTSIRQGRSSSRDYQNFYIEQLVLGSIKTKLNEKIINIFRASINWDIILGATGNESEANAILANGRLTVQVGGSGPRARLRAPRVRRARLGLPTSGISQT